MKEGNQWLWWIAYVVVFCTVGWAYPLTLGCGQSVKPINHSILQANPDADLWVIEAVKNADWYDVQILYDDESKMKFYASGIPNIPNAGEPVVYLEGEPDSIEGLIKFYIVPKNPEASYQIRVSVHRQIDGRIISNYSDMSISIDEKEFVLE